MVARRVCPGGNRSLRVGEQCPACVGQPASTSATDHERTVQLRLERLQTRCERGLSNEQLLRRAADRAGTGDLDEPVELPDLHDASLAMA